MAARLLSSAMAVVPLGCGAFGGQSHDTRRPSTRASRSQVRHARRVQPPDRARARALAAESVAAGDAVGWFETLYSEAADGAAVVPWADLEPNPFLVPVVDALPVPSGGRAIVVGCGYGD